MGRNPLSGDRTLKEFRVYTGRPSPSADNKSYSAWRALTADWEKNGVTVVSRALSYPPNCPRERPREKGIDVNLAVDFVAGAVDGAFDVGVIFSTDRDLLPALEFVSGHPELRVVGEAAARWVPGANAPLTIKGRSIWCHGLDAKDYQLIRDTTSYVRGR